MSITARKGEDHEKWAQGITKKNYLVQNMCVCVRVCVCVTLLLLEFSGYVYMGLQL
jgi:hypothetical protein